MSLSLASAADPGGAASPITRCPEKKQMLIQSHKLTKFSEADVFREKVVKRGKEDEVMRGEGVWEEAVNSCVWSACNVEGWWDSKVGNRDRRSKAYLGQSTKRCTTERGTWQCGQ